MNFLKIQRDERVTQEHRPTVGYIGIIAPNAYISDQNAPKSLAAGWGSAPDPAGEAYTSPLDHLAVMHGLGWRFGDNSCRDQVSK